MANGKEGTQGIGLNVARKNGVEENLDSGVEEAGWMEDVYDCSVSWGKISTLVDLSGLVVHMNLARCLGTFQSKIGKEKIVSLDGCEYV